MSLQDTRSELDKVLGLFDLAGTVRDGLAASGVQSGEDMVQARRPKSTDNLFGLDLSGMPQSPMAAAAEKYGKGGLFFRNLLSRGGKGIWASALLPDVYGEGAQDRYKAEMALWTKGLENQLDLDAHEKELAIMDPQVEAYARLFDKSDPLKAAAIRASNEVSAVDPNGYTLAPGGSRFNAANELVASGGDPVSAPGSVERRADAFAEGYGVQKGTKAYADIVAAMSEPTHTEKMPDGTERTYNTIDAVRQNILNGSYAGMGGPQAANGGAGGGGSAPGITADDVETANLRKQAMQWDNERQEEFKEKSEFYSRLQEQMDKMGVYDPETGTFTATDAVRDIYGSVDSKFPDWARGDDERMAQALVDQIVEILAVDERGKLKGQGQITEGETKMLRDSLTVLTNMGIGDKDMEDEIARLYRNVLGLSDDAANFRSRNPYRKQLEARADGMPAGFEAD